MADAVHGAPGAPEGPCEEQPFVATPDSGLTEAEAEQLTAEGKSNVDVSPRTRTVGQIVRDNVCTLFNAVNVLLAVVVFLTGSYRNMLFMIIVVCNAAIGIFQEVQSKRAVDQLSILAERPVRVRRGGKVVEVPSTGVVQGDLVLLSSGDQVPADLRVRSGKVVMNESLLTGESEPVRKGPDDRLLSGSFVTAGSCVGQAVAVGAASFAAQINDEARAAKPIESEIRSTLRFIVKLGTWVLLPVGTVLFLRSFFDGGSWQDAALTTVAAVTGMIPQGLVLLTSSVLAISTVRLAMQKVLVQQLYCIEALARVDVLCLDKTGTITSGAMTVEKLIPEPGVEREDLVSDLVTVMAANADDANDTARAVLAYQEEHALQPRVITRAVPFSSDRKYSGCLLETGGGLAVGAAQFLVPDRADALAAAEREAGACARLLAVCRVEGFDKDDRFTGVPVLLGFVAISDQVRDSAPATLAYFKEQGVGLRVISGDDPRTVAAIAQEAGVPDADEYVDATTLDTPEKLKRAARDCRVFGRVTPQQKRDLVLALQAEGHTVAMTGDGVNDVLALREADCSVAMAGGSDAARSVAEIVLVDDDFSHMPAVVAEGRRSINNLQRSAALFLEKTVFSIVVATLCIIVPPYPLLPIQLTLVSAAVIGIPSFVLALEPNHDRVRGSFLANVLAHAVPAALAISLGLAIVVFARYPLGMSAAQVSTIATCVTASVGLALVRCVSKPLNWLRRLLFWAMLAVVVLGVSVFGSFFEVATLTWPLAGFLALVAGAALALFFALFRRSVADADNPAGPYLRFARRVEKRTHDRRERRRALRRTGRAVRNLRSGGPEDEGADGR